MKGGGVTTVSAYGHGLQKGNRVMVAGVRSVVTAVKSETSFTVRRYCWFDAVMDLLRVVRDAGRFAWGILAELAWNFVRRDRR